jgi:lipopolysaccharide transport system permease protein
MVPESRYTGWAHVLVVANPLAYVVRAYRQVLLGNRVPNPRDLLVAAASGAAVFLLGGLFFRHMKRGFADVL